MSSPLGTLLKTLGLKEEEIERIRRQYLVDPRKGGLRGTLIPTARTVNIVTVIETHAPTILRHNEPEELFTLSMKVGRAIVPTIYMSGTKIAGMLRRRMRDIVGMTWESVKDKVHVFAKKLPDLKAQIPQEYSCAVVPKTRATGTNVEEQRVFEGFGYCKVCPVCWMFGFAVESGDYNLISRVVTDGAYATSSRSVRMTLNAVDDRFHITGQALFNIEAADSALYFVSNIRFKDASEWELMLLLYSIATMSEIGGRKTRFGTIKPSIVALVFDDKTVLTSYEIAKKVRESVAREEEISLELIRGIVRDTVKTGVVVVGDVSKPLYEVCESSLTEIVENAWYDSLARRAIHDRYWLAK